MTVFLTGSCLALGPGSSITGFSFLKLGVGARPVAMGQVFAGVADDANCLFYNPAGLALGCPFDVRVTLCQMLRGVAYFSGGFTAPVFNRLGVGLSCGYLNATDIRRDETGEELGTFQLSDLIIGPGLAIRPVKNFAIGGSGKFVSSRIDSFSSWALSFDFGILYQPIRYLTFGASLLHLGTPRRFIKMWEVPPVNLRGGVGFKLPFFNHYILMASDFSVYPDYGPNIGVGSEVKLDLKQLGASKQADILYLRGGYQSGGYRGFWNGFSFGMGYERTMESGLVVAVDLVYLFYGLLGDAQRVSLGLRFVP